MVVWISSLIALAVVCVFLLFMTPKTGNELSRKLAHIKSGTSGSTSYERQGDDFVDRVLSPLLMGVASQLEHRFQRMSLHELDKKLAQAGRPMDLGPEQFLALRLVVAVVGAIGLLIFSSASGELGLNTLLYAFAGAAIGWIMPVAWIDRLTRERQTAILNELPGVLDVLVITTEAGLTFDGAIRRICETSSGVLVQEFSKVLDDVRLNKPKSEALLDMAGRCGVDDLDIFITALIQAEKLGSEGITDTLKTFSESIREKRRQRIEEQGGKNGVTMLIPTAVFILPALFGVVLGPAMLDMMFTL